MKRSLIPLLVASIAMTLSSCGLPYYWQAVGGQLELLRKRTPIEKVLADPDTDEGLKASLSLAADIRLFASERLLLPDNDSYTSYADLGRSYVVWNVVAAEEFSIDPVRWCFPFAGCVAYRGFFERADAEQFAEKLRRSGYDVYAGGSTAYSTLGYFSDPVLNTMLGGGEEYLAPLLFHELAHQKVYVKDDSELSEAFASAIEEHGAELWLRERGRIDGLAAYRERIGRRNVFAGLVVQQQERLRAIYAGSGDDVSKQRAKLDAFELMRRDYSSVREGWEAGPNYDAWFDQPLNNASLAAVATYRRWLPALKQRLERVGLEQFYADVERLAELAPDERAAALGKWGSDASTIEVAAQGR